MITPNTAGFQDLEWLHQKHVLFLSEGGLSVPFTFVDGTDHLVAVDTGCTGKEEAAILQGFVDALTLARSAAKWPHDWYGVNATTMLFGKDAHKDTPIRQLASSTSQRASVNDPSKLASSSGLIVFICSKHRNEYGDFHIEPGIAAITLYTQDIITVRFGLLEEDYFELLMANIELVRLYPPFFEGPTFNSCSTDTATCD